ncbi:NitT/TauT family transport system ATP-binding protein [Bacillus tianshenii]|uniref:NitT/TauT family transport system ATP-binding protein n=1 Tax=Sutcliffiella tianshenii TaxID=1463404 RepID=A0ABS2P3G3_9BACI|nr:ABC transporter ATP-binding protein [Bacillus tianshenii]MBM7621424.1 NitT/TauT family transport system ATP-binding protein [Bacillus tianshenii]
MSFLSIDQIEHIYFTPERATKVLESISMAIEEGEFISFLGPSGCGKTTLLSIIAGLLKPTGGDVQLKGKRPSECVSDIGYMLQQDYLFPWKTIEENSLLGLKLSDSLTEDSKRRTLQLLKDMGLHDVEKLYPSQLSGGMRQRVALVRTLATDPQVLLLDEPFSALDYQTKLKLEDLVFSTLKSFQKTALLVTHDIGEAIAMSDRIFLLRANPGRVAKTFIVPTEIRQSIPFEARQHPLFSSLFQKIWKELETLESAD